MTWCRNLSFFKLSARLWNNLTSVVFPTVVDVERTQTLVTSFFSSYLESFEITIVPARIENGWKKKKNSLYTLLEEMAYGHDLEYEVLTKKLKSLTRSMRCL